MIEFWDAGQRRVAREVRDRKAAAYIAAVDAAISTAVVLGRVKWKGGGTHVPAYARSREQPSGRTLAQLLADHPGAVSPEPLEFRH